MYNCNSCNKPIKDGEEHFYIGYWYRNKVKSNVIHYHQECFEQIAGKEYAQRVIEGEKDFSEDIVSDVTSPEIRWKYIYWEENK